MVGRISGVYGVKGWVRIHSYTEPRENILGYRPWYLSRDGERQVWRLAEGRTHGKGIVVRLSGCEDRDQAATLVGAEVVVARAQLPATAPDEFYWSDLEGLRVSTRQGRDLGVVDHLLETGANDVLVVMGERERLIPYLWGDVVLEVDLAKRSMTVDWDPEF